MECIYCKTEISGKEKTNEHVIPQWVIKKLDIKKKQLSFTSISEKLEVFKPTTPIPHTFTHKVCASCNNGWLCNIDESCKDLLEVMIDGKDPKDFLNRECVEKLRILIYKIFLNFFATGPSSFKEKKLNFYHDFFKTKKPPENVYLFVTPFLNDKIFSINHLDGWQELYENQIIDDDGSGFRFKFYLQLGESALVLCSSGDERNIIVYDERYLIPLYISRFSIPTNFEQTIPDFHPALNTEVNHFLYDSIRVSRALIFK